MTKPRQGFVTPAGRGALAAARATLAGGPALDPEAQREREAMQMEALQPCLDSPLGTMPNSTGGSWGVGRLSRYGPPGSSPAAAAPSGSPTPSATGPASGDAG